MNVHIEEVKVFLMSSPYRNRGLYCSEGFKPFRFKVDRKDLETRKTFNSFMLPTVNFSLEAETNSFVFYKRARKNPASAYSQSHLYFSCCNFTNKN